MRALTAAAVEEFLTAYLELHDLEGTGQGLEDAGERQSLAEWARELLKAVVWGKG